MPESDPEERKGEIEAAAAALPLVIEDGSRLIDQHETFDALHSLSKHNRVAHSRVLQQIEIMYLELSESIGEGQSSFVIDCSQLKGIIAQAVSRAVGQLTHDMGRAILSAQELQDQVFGEPPDEQQ